jgi:hypothetical protein
MGNHHEASIVVEGNRKYLRVKREEKNTLLRFDDQPGS